MNASAHGPDLPSVPADSDAREFCFVIMSYRSEYDAAYTRLKAIVEQASGLLVLRADRRPEPGHDLLDKVHRMVRGASVIVADVSEHSPNVYYEYGYASALGRSPILVASHGAELSTDLKGKEVLRYGHGRDDSGFADDLVHAVLRQLRSPLPEQRRMLAGASPFPAYVLAAPLALGAASKPHWWHPSERETYGDWVGIAGIVSAYGNLFGASNIPHLLHAQRVSDELDREVANFFCIGSPKVNPHTARWLERLQTGLRPQWRLEADDPTEADTRGVIRGGPPLAVDLLAPMQRHADGTLRDWGLLIRFAHPDDDRHLVLLAAGRHSLGTDAACRFATRREHIAALETELQRQGLGLATGQPFWALVQGVAHIESAVPARAALVAAGGYEAV